MLMIMASTHTRLLPYRSAKRSVMLINPCFLPRVHMRLPRRYMHSALSRMFPATPKKDIPVR